MSDDPGSRGTMLDDSLRETPASGYSGEIDLDTGTGHGTQYYDGGYRYSRDFPDDQNGHWTNQNVDRDDDGRHNTPPDAEED